VWWSPGLPWRTSTSQSAASLFAIADAAAGGNAADAGRLPLERVTAATGARKVSVAELETVPLGGCEGASANGAVPRATAAAVRALDGVAPGTPGQRASL
jgi:hypothetical protein